MIVISHVRHVITLDGARRNATRLGYAYRYRTAYYVAMGHMQDEISDLTYEINLMTMREDDDGREDPYLDELYARRRRLRQELRTLRARPVTRQPIIDSDDDLPF